MLTTGQSIQPIPMTFQYKDHSLGYSNSFKNNRVAPQQHTYNSYSQPNNYSSTNSQWKILGIIVSTVLLITTLITLSIFIYCYKVGRIANNYNKNKTNANKLAYHQEDDFDNGNSNNKNNWSYYMPCIPYGNMQNISTFSINEDAVQVEDKQTNTEATMAPLRPRDWQYEVWLAKNAYGGLSYRPFNKPKMVDRFVETLPSDIDQTLLQQKNTGMNVVPKTIIRLPENHHQYNPDQYPSRFIEQTGQYNVVEKIVQRSKIRLIEKYIVLRKNDENRIRNVRKIKRFNNISIEHVKAMKKPDILQDDFTNDHFYQ
ncbi:unnamed protein product [Rotaria sp. Silwood2]|nr:unnamed protein product [Rotaria sp. Silwood2]CAF4463707.1 unnamed protein product [Rotaria sp. Silwood2]